MNTISIVVPVHDEAENLEPLIAEIDRTLPASCVAEIICVDDGSRDGSSRLLREIAPRHARLRVLTLDRRCGQSAAIRAGVRAARSRWIATLDGDGQNVPADILRLVDARDAAGTAIGLLVGWRVERKDAGTRRWASWIANAVRARVLRDGTPDTGCGIKLFERDGFLDLPYFDHMHRFLPALMQRAGRGVISVPVRHRPRGAGKSKYGNWQRLRVGVVDLLGVAWLVRRSSTPRVAELTVLPAMQPDAQAQEPVS